MSIKFKLVFATLFVFLLGDFNGFSQTKELRATFDQQNFEREQHLFLNYSKSTRIPRPKTFTDRGFTNYVLWLSNRSSPTNNLATSLTVRRGDTIHVKVSVTTLPFAYQKVGSVVLARFLAAFVGISSGRLIAEGDMQSFGRSSPTGIVAGSSKADDMRAFVNWISFDESFTLVDAGYKKADLQGSNRTGSSTLKLTLSIPVRQSGFVYVYLSNESSSEADVYFDDFIVTQLESSYLITENSQHILTEDNQYIIPEN